MLDNSYNLNQSSLKNIPYSYMKLTNNLSKPNLEELADFSQCSVFNARQQMINNSVSCDNETLLLETTEIFPNRKNDFNRNNIPGQQLNREMISYCQSSLGDLCSQLEITLSNDQSKLHQEFGKSKHNDLCGVCRYLIDTLKRLETKFNRIQDRQNRKVKKYHRYSSFEEQQQKQVQSTFTYSQLKDSKDCQCGKYQISCISGLEQSKSPTIYKLQNEDLIKQTIKLKESIQGMRKTIKKMQGENTKLKELLKQYQNFNKKKATEIKILKDQKSLNNVLSQRILNPAKSRIFPKMNQELEAYVSRSVSSHIIQTLNPDNEHIRDCRQYVISSKKLNPFNRKKQILKSSLISIDSQISNKKPQKLNVMQSNFNIHAQRYQNRQISQDRQWIQLRLLNKIERYQSEYKKQNYSSQNKRFGKALLQIHQTQQNKYDQKDNNVPNKTQNCPKTFKQIRDMKKNEKQNGGISKNYPQVFHLNEKRKE